MNIQVVYGKICLVLSKVSSSRSRAKVRAICEHLASLIVLAGRRNSLEEDGVREPISLFSETKLASCMRFW